MRGLVLVIWLGALGVALWSGSHAQAAINTFANTASISIGPGAGAAGPYPSNIVVSGLAGNILDVNVTLHGVSHNRPDDLDVLLVGPGGQTVILTSDACGNLSPGGANFTFDDEASGPLPDTDGGTPCATGTYQPWDYSGGGSDGYFAPAPAGPYGSTLSVFDGTNPNGTWSLYIMDDSDSYGGPIGGGWSLTIETEDPPTETPTVTVGPGTPTPTPGLKQPAAPIITAEDVKRSQAPLCADLTGTTNPIVRADVPVGTVTNGWVYCRVIAQDGEFVGMNQGAAALGNLDVLAQGVIHAVDIFGMSGGLGVAAFNNPVEVCLQGSGRFLFLDATQAPRTASQLPASSAGGYTCASIPNAGTVVLVP